MQFCSRIVCCELLSSFFQQLPVDHGIYNLMECSVDGVANTVGSWGPGTCSCLHVFPSSLDLLLSSSIR